MSIEIEIDRDLRAVIPGEIAQAAAVIDPARFARQAAADLHLDSGAEAALKKSLASFLSDVWKTRSYYQSLLPVQLTAEQSLALNQRLEAEVFTPLIRKLTELGIGPESVLYEAKKVRLTGALFQGHTTDRITIKSLTKGYKGGFLFPRRDYYDVTLDIDYAERGRWGDYEVSTVTLPSMEDVERFKAQLQKAVQVGTFLNFVEFFRRFQLSQPGGAS